jgi:hypothetical protein
MMTHPAAVGACQLLAAGQTAAVQRCRACNLQQGCKAAKPAGCWRKALQPQGVGHHDVIERAEQRAKKRAAILLQGGGRRGGCLVKLVIHPLVVAGLQRKLFESVHGPLLKTAR